MAHQNRHEFHFIVDGMHLGPEQIQKIAAAVSDGGARALNEVLPAAPVAVPSWSWQWYRGRMILLADLANEALSAAQGNATVAPHLETLGGIAVR